MSTRSSMARSVPGNGSRRMRSLNCLHLPLRPPFQFIVGDGRLGPVGVHVGRGLARRLRILLRPRLPHHRQNQQQEIDLRWNP